MKSRCQATALVITLVLLMLLAGVAIAFFSQVTTEARSAKSFADSVSTRQLAESAVAAVMAQVREATTVKNGAWASQPGMIRVFGSNGSASSEVAGFYKLYSSDNMVLNSNDAKAYDAANEVPSDWAQTPALFTDLNQAATIGTGDKESGKETTVKRYPIIDPSLADTKVAADRLVNIPEGWQSSLVEGLRIDRRFGSGSEAEAPMPVRWLYVLRDGTLTAPVRAGSDGLTAIWDKAVGDAARRTPSRANPIVGRVAFWADDDTSRININTAGGYCMDARPASYQTDLYAGSFWDTPRFVTQFEKGLKNAKDDGLVPVGGGGLANTQPTQGEFQRYPGHPSTTSLSVLFHGGKYENPKDGKLMPSFTLSSELLYQLTPRVGSYGSMGGTKRSRKFILGSNEMGPDDGRTEIRFDRLYSSVDEMLFAPPVITPPSPFIPRDYDKLRRTLNDDRLADYVVYHNDKVKTENNPADLTISYAKSVITPDLLDKLRFFLTAYSRAPELNLFGRPRITAWPVWDDSKKGANGLTARSVYDRLIYFCSTLGPERTSSTGPLRVFEFVRNNPYSATDDLSIQDGQNMKLLTYLRSLTSTTNPIPGFGGSFEGKYGNDRDQILTEIYDYFRCVNLKDKGLDPTKPQTATPYTGTGLVVPTRVTLGKVETRGFGRFPTISEASIVFYHAGWFGKKRPGTPPNPSLPALPTTQEEVIVNPYSNVATVLSNAAGVSQPGLEGYELTGTLMRAFLVFETFNPMAGYAPLSGPTAANNADKVYIDCQFINATTDWSVTSSQIARGSLAFPTVKSRKYLDASGSCWGGRNFGGYEGILHTVEAMSGDSAPFVVAAYPFQTDPSQLKTLNPLTAQVRVDLLRDPITGKLLYEKDAAGNDTPEPKRRTFNFNGGSVRIQIGLGANSPSQTFTLVFPPGTNWPVPTWYNTSVGNAVPATPYLWVAAKGVNNGGFQPYWTGIARAGGWEKALSLDTRLDWLNRSGKGYSGTPIVGADAGLDFTNKWRGLLQPGDTVRSLECSGGPGGKTDDPPDATGRGGDLRILALYDETTSTDKDPRFRPHANYNTPSPAYPALPNRQAQSLRLSDGSTYYGNNGQIPPGATYALGTVNPPTSTTYFGKLVNVDRGATVVSYAPGIAGDLSAVVTKGATREDGGAADFDTGLGSFGDGAFLNKVDEGNFSYHGYDELTKTDFFPIPYFGTWTYEPPGDTYFSPNRQLPSAGMIGSLSSRGLLRKGWETLCFTPAPAGVTHFGIATGQPHDHLLLDLFTMPVVEPYAISEPFSTAGKVNLNYQIQPFTYIRRTTALRAALYPVRLTAVPKDHVDTYKKNDTPPPQSNRATVDFNPTKPNYRMLVDRDTTLQAIEGEVFSKGEIFKSATEICDRFLYPLGFNGKSANYKVSETGPLSIREFWTRNTLTGDNMREKPYVDLLPRVTTRSNTFTVYVRVQAVRQPAAPKDEDYLQWRETSNSVVSEYRGESTIERYLDPQDRRFDPNNADTKEKGDAINPEKDSIEPAFRFRTVYSKRFAP
ncbi:MAG: hypothetical protein QOE70_5535 [Chthoniobacter sp.]|jgi:uncharacterized protein (TIGR02600 family)|nr:hypothetical protein [Chthoniobacter sp.]